MQFVKIGEYLAASRITGPKHNLLQIRLATLDSELLYVVCLPAAGNCTHEPLDEKLLVEAVQEGVVEANKELGSNYAVSGIRYVQNDTKPEMVYGFMARSILRHLHSNGTFERSVGTPPQVE